VAAHGRTVGQFKGRSHHEEVLALTVFQKLEIESTGVEIKAYGPKMAEARIQKVENDSSQFKWRSYSCELEATDVAEIGETALPPSAA
jgi:hypothetical protein